MHDAKLDARLRLLLAEGIGPGLSRRMAEAFGCPVAALEASPPQLQQHLSINAERAQRIRRALDQVETEQEWSLIDSHGVHLLSIDDEQYPVLLRHIHDPPGLLYVRGRIEREDAVAIGVVGSRRCTGYGREQADRLSASCAQAGLTIVSGGARGIDAAAHRATVRVGGRTIAILGCGLAKTYPPENKELFARISDGHGALISELPMMAPPIGRHFPRRNRLISAMSLGVLVVEAASRSGALITARLAAEEHHREVLALPGRVDSPASVGCHRMLREGWATLVTNAADILDALGETGQMLRAALPQPEDADTAAGVDDRTLVRTRSLTSQQQALFEAVPRQAESVDQVMRKVKLPAATVQSELMMLQLRGLIERLPGNQVRRR